jgi:malate synthase
MKAYERNNVATGLRTHIPQIGAGMWPKTKDMKGLLDSKRSQIKQGTDTSWSPSPSAAVIHALAFMTSPPSRAIQSALRDEAGSLTQLEFSVAPYVDFPHLAHDIDDKAINDHLNNAVHGLISYAHPWVRHGIGCSAIADMNGVLLMEDRATARIKAAFIRNWLAHDVVTTDAVVKSIIAMAAHVDLHLQTLNPEHQPIVTQALHEHDWGQCDPILQAVHDVIFNPKNEVFSYVETYFYPAHRAVLSASRPTKPL